MAAGKSTSVLQNGWYMRARSQIRLPQYHMIRTACTAGALDSFSGSAHLASCWLVLLCLPRPPALSCWLQGSPCHAHLVSCKDGPPVGACCSVWQHMW